MRPGQLRGKEWRTPPGVYVPQNTRFLAGLFLGGKFGVEWLNVVPEAGAYVIADTRDYVSVVPYVGVAFQFGPLGIAEQAKSPTTD